MKTDFRDAHGALLSAIELHKRDVRDTFKYQQQALEEIRLNSTKIGTKVALLIAVLGTAGGAIMSMVMKHFGG